MNPTTINFQLGSRSITMETGRIARQATAAVVVRCDPTVVLVTVTAAPEAAADRDFFPLTVEYREKTAAAGRIPGNFMRREGRISDHEVLCSRLIDRSIRPLFPPGFRNEVQVQAQVLSAGAGSDPAPLALLGATAALHLSPVPWDGPAAGLRLARVEDRLVPLPLPAEREEARAELMVSAGPTGLVMVEGEAREIDGEETLEMLFTAADLLDPVREAFAGWRREAGAEKWAFTPPVPDAAGLDELATRIGAPLAEALTTPIKQERREAVAALREKLLEGCDDEAERSRLEGLYENLKKNTMRRAIAVDGKRPDGRGPEQIRPITCEAGWLPGPHGSAIFTRGETQALVSCTLAGAKSAQLVEGLEGTHEERFLLHYNFPPYSVGETRPLRGPGRREIGHGTLARKALTAVLPSYEDFPYVIRLESDIAESNGSSSMATVCGGCLALCDTGVPVAAPVAGIAMGLIQEGERTVVLSDILGDEDHLGDMDFKVTGTARGITALQMDNKIGGLSREVMAQALDQARRGLDHILGEMAKTLAGPRPQLAEHAPQAHTVRIRPDAIGMLIGPKGQTIKSIQEESGAQVSVDDTGLVSIYASEGAAARLAMRLIRQAAGEVQKGRVYQAEVVTVRDFGAFVRIYPHVEGLVHVSQWDEGAVEDMNRVVREGDRVMVRVMGADEKGRLVLSRREALGVDPADAAN